MKKLMKSSLAFFVAFSMIGCTSAPNSDAIYKAGKYSVTTNGNNGEVEVEVTFTDDKIDSIDVVSHKETEGLGDKALEKVKQEILEKQSTDVDTVSGATFSSKAMIEAVNKAISEASVNGSETGSKEFTPGTYTTTVNGHNGDMTVTMKFSKDSIESIDVDNVESNGIGTAAIDIITNEVLDNQTLNVDSVSGATVTSGALISAINDCVEQTGIDKSTLDNEVAYPKASDEPIEKEADVVVIGTGGAGFAAAVEVVENGGTLIMLEKNEYIGGNTARAGGTLNAPDPERQSKIGVEDSVDLFYENIMSAGDNKSDPKLVRVLAENALDARHWLSDHGTEWTEIIYQTIGGLWPRSMDEKDKVAYNGFIEPLAKVVEKNDGEIILNCKAEELIVDKDGKVTGVKAVDTKNGQEYTINANNAVIMATGGYAANSEMVEEYNGVSGLPTSNAPTSTGDGIEMAKAIDADLEGMEYIQIHPHGNPTTGGLQSHFAGVIANSIYVNKEGKRFTEESGRRDTISEDTIKQTDQIMYSIFDAKGGFYAGVTELENKEDLIDKGYLYEADTIEELAEKAGLDADNLVETVEHYNEMVDAGEDTDFEKDELDQKIENGPFYCVPLSPTLHHTMGGLKINTKAQVLNTSGKVIDGLYAAGEVTGGIHGTNRIGGNALTDCVVFGRIAGQNAMGVAE